MLTRNKEKLIMPAGIDYGRGQTNIDTTTGIRYGVICQHSVMPEALDDVFTQGDDLSFAAWKKDLTAKIRAAIADAADDCTCRNEDIADEFAGDIADRIVEESDYDSSESIYRYERDGYVIENSPSLMCLMILKSPYKTRAAFCSPCVPGAGDLDSPRDDGAETYCLGADWFEDEKAPYPIETV